MLECAGVGKSIRRESGALTSCLGTLKALGILSCLVLHLSSVHFQNFVHGNFFVCVFLVTYSCKSFSKKKKKVRKKKKKEKKIRGVW